MLDAIQLTLISYLMLDAIQLEAGCHNTECYSNYAGCHTVGSNTEATLCWMPYSWQ